MALSRGYEIMDQLPMLFLECSRGSVKLSFAEVTLPVSVDVQGAISKVVLGSSSEIKQLQ